jgi:hypothetical protein
MLGPDFDYFALPVVHTCGGILVAWDANCWSVSSPILRSHSLSVKVAPCANPDVTWWLTNVYGPQGDAAKIGFLHELRDLRESLSGPWAICGDFNLIYQASDKSNGHLSRRMMGRFRRLLNDLELSELHLSGRLFTWSNERLHPTLERIDRMFVSEGWESLYPGRISRPSLPIARTMLLCSCSLMTGLTPNGAFVSRPSGLRFKVILTS